MVTAFSPEKREAALDALFEFAFTGFPPLVDDAEIANLLNFASVKLAAEFERYLRYTEKNNLVP